MSRSRIVILALLTGIIANASAAPDQAMFVAATESDTLAQRVVRPNSIVVHEHKDLVQRDFLPGLYARLHTVLAPQVVRAEAAYDLAPFRSRWGKLDAAVLLASLVESLDWTSDPNAVHVVLIPDDMRLEPARFNFAASTGNADTRYHVVIISLARLQRIGLVSGVDVNPDRTARRVFKMAAKNVAKVAGYSSSERCLFAFPKSLADLDAMPEGFCEPDLTALVRLGIAKPIPARRDVAH